MSHNWVMSEGDKRQTVTQNLLTTALRTSRDLVCRLFMLVITLATMLFETNHNSTYTLLFGDKITGKVTVPPRRPQQLSPTTYI